MRDKKLKHIIDRDLIGKSAAAKNAKADTDHQYFHSHNKAGKQTYCFEFGDNDQNYLISFEGKLTHEDIHKMLETLHSRLYKNCSEAIQLYLKQHHIEYTHFKTEISLLVHEEIMSQTEELLKSYSCDLIDNHIGKTDHYYAVMDYQKQIDEERYEGCYYAVKRTADRETYNYRIIGQIFTYDYHNDNQNGYFTIQAGDDSQQLHNIDTKAGYPVLPVFGCVDMINILLNIDNIRTVRQTEEAAI